MTNFNARLERIKRLIVFSFAMSPYWRKYQVWKHSDMLRLPERRGTWQDVQDTTPLLTGGWKAKREC